MLNEIEQFEEMYETGCWNILKGHKDENMRERKKERDNEYLLNFMNHLR